MRRILILTFILLTTISYAKHLKLSSKKDIEYYLREGRLALNQARFSDAINYFSKAIGLNSGYSQGYYYRGQAFLFAKHYYSAAKDFSEFIIKNPSNPKGYYSRGLANFYGKEYLQAIKDLTKAKEIKPSLINIHNIRGQALFKLKKYKYAIIDFIIFINYNPTSYPAIYLYLGIAYEQVGDKENSIISLRNYLKLSKNRKAREFVKRKLKELSLKNSPS